MSTETSKKYVSAVTQAIWDSYDSFKEDSRSEVDSRSMRSARDTTQALVTVFEKSSEKLSDDSIYSLGGSASLLGAYGLQALLVDALENLPRGTSSLRPGLYYASGVAHETAGDIESAKKMFLESRKCGRAQKQNLIAISAAIDIGRLAFQDDDLNKARLWYEKAFNEASLHGGHLMEATVLTNMSAMYLDTEPIRAAELAKKSLDIKREYHAPESSVMRSLGNLGIAKAKCGSHKEALVLFEDVLEIAKSLRDPSAHARALLNVAIQKSILGDFRSAKDIFRKALRLVGKTSDEETKRLLQQAFAVYASKNGEYRLAEKNFAELYRTWVGLSRRKDAAIALHDRALCLARLGDQSMARDSLTQALSQFEQLHDRDWQRRCLLMMAIELEKPRSEEKIEILYEATGIRGGRDKELRMLCSWSLWQTLLDRGEFDQATRQLNREAHWLAKQPEELSERLHIAAMELLDRNRVAEAAKVLRKAMSLLQPNDIAVPWLRQDLASALARTGDFDEAIHLVRKNYELAKRQDNRLLEMHSVGNLGELERENGKTGKAIPLLEKAILLARKIHDLGEEAFWKNNLALAIFDQGKTGEAQEVLRQAIKNAEIVHDVAQEARAWGSMGVISAKTHDFEDAVQQYDLAIAKGIECEDKIFASEMMYDKAASLYHQGARDEALLEAEKALNIAHKISYNDLARDVGITAAVWSIEWRRPAQAASFWASAFLCDLLTETAMSERIVAVFVIAKQKLGAGQYKQFSSAVRRETAKSIEKEEVSGLIDRLEMKIDEELGRKEIE